MVVVVVVLVVVVVVVVAVVVVVVVAVAVAEVDVVVVVVVVLVVAQLVVGSSTPTRVSNKGVPQESNAPEFRRFFRNNAPQECSMTRMSGENA